MRAATPVAVLVTLALGMAAPLAAVPVTANGTVAMHTASAPDVEGGARRKLWVCIASVAMATVAASALLVLNPVAAVMAAAALIAICS